MSEAAAPSTIELKSHYVRERHCMAVFGSFSPFYMDYYLHQMQLGRKPDPDHDLMLKELMSAVVLHLMSRPRDEITAWTVNLQAPSLNLFVTGDSVQGNACGRLFTRNVKKGDRSLFFAQVTRTGAASRQSTVEVDTTDMLRAVEQYYRQSEQLPARFFRLPDEEFAMLVAHPDRDLPWFEAQTAESMARLLDDEDVGYLETRSYHFGCGCNETRILNALLPVARQAGVDELFGDQVELDVECPRCAARFLIERPRFEDFLSDQPSS